MKTCMYGGDKRLRSFADAQATSSMTDDPLAVGRGRVPLLYIQRSLHSVSGLYLLDKSEFVGNIISIRNCYEGSKAGDASVSEYIATIDAELDAKVKALIEESMDIIGSIPEPFAANATCEAANNAVVKVGTELVEALEEVYTAISE